MTTRRASAAISIAVGALLLVSGCSGTADGAGSGTATPTASAAPSPEPSPSSTPVEVVPPVETPAPVAPAVGMAPSRVVIPALGLDEELIDLGIAADGSLEVPEDFSRVGWFTGGGRPGGIGPTVIAGHVDSAVGPAVFFELSTLVVGDRFSVVDISGASFEYEVYRAEDFPKNAFPTAQVFGALLSDEVRLITCTGLFDESIGHYDDNRVVFAARTKP